MSYMKSSVLIMFLALVTLSCDSNDISNDQTKEIDFFEISKGDLGGNGLEGITQSNWIISNNSDWQSLLIKIDSVNIISSGFEEIDIDFDQFMVFATFLDVKSSIWYVEVVSVLENSNTISISIDEIETGLETPSQPFHIIKIPAIDKSIIVQ